MGEVGGIGGRGDRASDNEGQPDNGGEGRGRESFGERGRLKREKRAREGRKRTTARERERDASEMKEGGEGERTPKWSGPRLPAEGQWDEQTEQRDGRFPRLPRALSRGLAQSGNCGWGAEAGKGAPTSPGRTRSLPPPRPAGSSDALILAV